MRCRLKAVSDVDKVTLDGRLFHVREATTGNARLTMMEWQISGTTSVNVDADLRRFICSFPLYSRLLDF